MMHESAVFIPIGIFRVKFNAKSTELTGRIRLIIRIKRCQILFMARLAELETPNIGSLEEQKMLAKIFLGSVGLMYLALATWCSTSPAITSDKVGFILDPGSGQSEFLVIYGGLEMGMALIFLLPLFFTKYIEGSLLACIAIHACLVLFRTISLFIYTDFEGITYNLAIGEWVILILSLICWFSLGKSDK